jgi:hypothetical protein
MPEDTPDPSAPQISPEEMARLEAQELATLRKLVEDGKTLTEAQWRRLRAAASVSADTAESFDGPEWVENQTELARAIGLKDSPNTRKTIQRWLKQDGNPGHTPDGRYHVPSWKAFAEQHGRKRATSGKDKHAIEVEGILIKNERNRIELEQTKGNLLDIETVCSVLTQMANAAALRLNGSRHTLGPQVVGCTVPEATKRIGVEHHQVLLDLSVVPDWAKKKAHPEGLFWRNVSARLSALLQIADPGNGPSNTS